MHGLRSVLLLAFLTLQLSTARGEGWPQFRGPNGSGHAADKHPLPADLADAKNLVWKVELPSGHSSPIVQGDRVYVTGVRDKKLLTLALDRATGKTVWEAEAPYKTLEVIHPTGGSYAQATPVTDGDNVISFFGSSGAFCYDRAGKLLWHHAMGPFNNDFGAASSPLLVGEQVIIAQDHDSDSFLLALDKYTGKVRWKTDRSEFRRGFSTPIVWEVAGKRQLVVVGMLRVVGYDLDTGRELWTVRGLARLVNPTPVVGPDNVLYLSAWTMGADPSDKIELPPFAEMLAKVDTNKNGTLEESEIKETVLNTRFGAFDRNKDTHVQPDEYEAQRQIFAQARNVVLAIKPGGQGDLTASHVLWSYSRSIPYVPSPLLYDGVLFLIKDGGILTCLDAKTGKELSQERVFGGGKYHSSPVLGDGKLYLVNQEGLVNVIEARAKWKALGRTKLEGAVHSTPAIADGRIYIRTAQQLVCFGLPAKAGAR